SMRRLAHYDYWSDKVRRSILLDAKADLVGFGMGEAVIVEIARRLADGRTVADLRDMRGVAYALGAREELPDIEAVRLPSYEEVVADPIAFCDATRLIHMETNPYNARALIQYHDQQAVVQMPPALPLSTTRLDEIHELPYTRQPHPAYREKIPAWTVIKDSVTIMRGCFGGCTFCSITTHQGRIVQSRSKESVLRELKVLSNSPDFKGTVSDIGGPTANMYEMKCTRPEVEKICRRLSCVHPTICKLLGTDHAPLIDLMRSSRRVKGVKKVLVASGVRMDLARRSPEYIKELTTHHVGGHLKVAPEHSDSGVLDVMKKPSMDDFDVFAEQFDRDSRRAGKEQYLVPYFIASHPGCGPKEMIDLAVYLKRGGYKPDQVQDFIPAPMDIAAAMYHTGLDPFTKRPVQVAKHMRDRKVQRAMMQFFKPENYFVVRQALIKAGRQDLIGEGCDALIPKTPPAAALAARRRRQTGGSESGKGREQRRAASVGYRPGRRGAVGR
ncbi:MAG: YgiQ family radical SAM protein, partial [Planctomycetes bacterium]|nr:YgiQ family radical SAM protein [Planctomycetota bacterium]